jgi:translation initiation factor 5
MGLVNIGDCHSDDMFYRYKMPVVETKVEGKGNGIKTKLVNIDQVAQALGRPERMLLKYLGASLGTSVTGNVLRGAHQVEDIMAHISKFVDAYVLCQVCTNPETTLKVKKDRLKATCKACGAKSYIDGAKHVDTVMKSLPA